MNMQVLLPYVQSGGIITSFLLASFTAWRSLRLGRVSAYTDLVKSHRDLWSLVLKEKGLEGVLSKDIDDWHREITSRENIFVNFIINHLSCSFELMKVGNIITPHGLESDIQQFFSCPIPSRIWQSTKHLRNPDFVLFVDRAFVNQPRPAKTNAS